MDNNKQELDNLIREVKDYLENRSRLGKLKAIEKGSQIGAAALTGLTLIIILVFFLLFLSIGIALFISGLLNSMYAGFGIVAASYFILGMIVYIRRESWLRRPLVNSMIRSFLNDDRDES